MPTSSGVIDEVADLAVLERDDLRRPRRRDLVETVGAMHRPDPLRSELMQNLRQRLEPHVGKYAEQLARHAGRVGQGTEQVEHRARAEFDAHRRHMPHGGVMRLGEHEAQARLGKAALETGRIEADLHAERGQDVGRAGFRRGCAVAVLGDRTPQAATMIAASVEML